MVPSTPSIVRDGHSTGRQGSLRRLLFWLTPPLVYVVVAAYSLHLPGVYYDEVLQAVTALTVISGPIHGPTVEVTGSVIQLGPFRFPLLILPYLGSTQAGVLAATFALFGPTVTTMRLTYIALGVVALICAVGLTRRMFGAATAVMLGLLLALDPAFVFSTRSDNGPVTIMLICKLGALWLMLRWWQDGSGGVALIAAAFLCGLGLYDKLNFAWFLGAVSLTLAMLASREAIGRLRALSPRMIAGVCLAFCVGAGVPLLYILATGGEIFHALLHLSESRTSLGVNNTDLVGNLIKRFSMLFSLLQGYLVLDFYMSSFMGVLTPYQRAPFLTTLVLPLWLMGGALGLFQSVFRMRWGLPARSMAALSLVTVLMVVMSIVTPTSLSYHHLLIVYPFPHMVAASVVASLPRLLRGISARIAASSALVPVVALLAILPSLGVTARYHQVLAQSGGVGMWSDAIYGLAEHLRGDQRTIAVMDWGLGMPLMLLSAGALSVEEHWRDFLYVSGQSPAMEALVCEPGQVFVFHSPQHSGVRSMAPIDGPRDGFFQTVASLGMQAQLERRLYQRNGEPVIELYTVTHPLPLFSQPDDSCGERR